MTHSDPPDAASEGTYSIRAVQRVCDLLDLLQHEPGGTSLARAAEVARLPKSSAFRYLATLEERRYVERDFHGDYRLGLALLPMQVRQLDVLTRRIRPYLSRLQEEFGETANLGVLDGNGIVYLDIVESEHAMRLAARPGDRDPMHATALGKAIAAQLSVERVKMILKAEGMPRLTELTIVTAREFFQQLETVRRHGYALDEGENELGVRCIAVAVEDVHLPIAISVSGPGARFTPDQLPAAIQRLREISAELTLELMPPTPAPPSA